MYGLARSDAASAALLLNLEPVFTAALAWVVFRENVDRRIFAGMMAIVAGGTVLSWEQMPRAAGISGPALIAGACLAWALDNNLTRRISGGDAVAIAAFKAPGAIAVAALVGLLGYGVSLVLFIMALRDLGTARTSAYFSTAPFFGAALALLIFNAPTGPAFWAAAALMALGVWLHITERHEHEHVHEPMIHAHEHVHDAHHLHEHPAGWDGHEPHTHVHEHARLRHRHPHYPDLHHRHRHRAS
jgi:drug/metabolite transporter (DMT)-like permease